MVKLEMKTRGALMCAPAIKGVICLRVKKFTGALPGVVILALSMISIALIVFIFFFVISRALPVIKASGLQLLTTVRVKSS